MTHPIASDDHLVERARAGDLDAFNALVDRHQRQVYTLCFRMLGTREAAEDAAQEAFLLAFRRVGDFRGGQFRSWLLRIATNVSIDELRRLKRRTATPLERDTDGEPATIEAPDPKAGPEELTLGAELRASLERALATLPPEQRAAVVLADVQGLSYEDVAGVLGCSVGTVKSRIFRARERLRAYLQALPEPPAPAVRPTGERSNVTGREGP